MSIRFWILMSLMVAPGFTGAQSFDRFQKPQMADEPTTFWHWMNGHVTQNGITNDLETMKSVGVGGTLLFSIGYFPAGPVKFMSDEWISCVAHAIKESDRLGLTFGIYNSDGWSMSGGPWITPEESMKQIVWSETKVAGGTRVTRQLAQPPGKLIYEDVAILAFPAVEGDGAITPQGIKQHHLVKNPEAAFDGTTATAMTMLKPDNSQSAELVVDLGEVSLLRRVEFEKVKSEGFMGTATKVELSKDGINYSEVGGGLPMNLKAESLINQLTFSFRKMDARYVRLSMDVETTSSLTPIPRDPDSVEVGEVRFYESPRVRYWEPKSGNSKRIRHDRQRIFTSEMNSVTEEILPAAMKVEADKQIDLSDKINSQGLLTWDAPVGDWTVLRVGYTSTDRKGGPATAEGRGLECDKMDAKSVEKHFNAYAGKISDLSQKLIGRPIDYMQMESWEAGVQNWTKGFEVEFEKRNGYSILPYLPVLAGGYVVDSYETSDKFLWDFRETVSAMIAENYWSTMLRCARERGIKVSGEGSGMQHYLYDPMRYMKETDIPMGEFWPNEGIARADMKNASSVAHTYGRKLVGGESFTHSSPNLWSVTPFDLKRIGDQAFALGANLFVLHSYVHQPYDVAPGFTLGRFGTYFHRLNPWFTQAQGWLDYIARCQYMLRQGEAVQDIAYFTGEGIPSSLGLRWELHPEVPPGLDYDGVNLELLKMMTVKNGRIVLPSGANYGLLIVPYAKRMTPDLLAELKRLVEEGAAVLIGDRPVGSPSLKGDKQADDNVKLMAEELWALAGKDGSRLFTGADVAKVINEISLAPDFEFSENSGPVEWVHRRDERSDIYFVAHAANGTSGTIKGKGSFRVSGKVPELWDADRGTTRPLAYEMTDGRTVVDLEFDPRGSVFVVFNKETTVTERMPERSSPVQTMQIEGPWKVEFGVDGEPLEVVLENLTDWSKNENERIKYFSGSTTYTKEFELGKIDGRIEISLGDVCQQLATVSVNGVEAGRMWRPPYTLDITDRVRGRRTNRLEICVTNTGFNMQAGDDRYEADVHYDKKGMIREFPNWLTNPEQRDSRRKTFVTYKPPRRKTKLDASGLIGPVVVREWR